MQVKKQKQLSDNQTNEQTSLFVILYRQEAEAYLHIAEPQQVPQMIKDLMVHDNHNKTYFIIINHPNRVCPGIIK
jgi:hypothetical protein